MSKAPRLQSDSAALADEDERRGIRLLNHRLPLPGAHCEVCYMSFTTPRKPLVH